MGDTIFHRHNLLRSFPGSLVLHQNSSLSSSGSSPSGREGLDILFLKRRRKRTVEQRIQHFRYDPYVARFDEYAALCALCERWIRLRPNSVYCSIPWEAHRKSCLAKTIKTLRIATETVDEIDDMDLRSWTHLQRYKNGEQFPGRLEDPENILSAVNLLREAAASRRRVLCSDPLIGLVELGRVFCKSCEEWVRLRHDKPYCIKSWLFHRETCFSKRSLWSVSSPTHVDQTRLLLAPVMTDEPRPPHVEIISEKSMAGLSITEASKQESPGTYEDVQPSNPNFHLGQNESSAGSCIELSTAAGRRHFVNVSLTHLFATSYSSDSDFLSVAQLLTYLNAAIPEGKWEDFGFLEVVKLVGRTSQVRLEGDRILPDLGDMGAHRSDGNAM